MLKIRMKEYKWEPFLWTYEQKMNFCTEIRIRFIQDIGFSLNRLFACVMGLSLSSIFLNCKSNSINEKEFPIAPVVIFLTNISLFDNNSSSGVQWDSRFSVAFDAIFP